MCFSLFVIVQRSLNTILESITTDAGHTVWDGYGSQAAATIEGIVADAGHTLWDGH